MLLFPKTTRGDKKHHLLAALAALGLLALAPTNDAHGFCGTFVGAPGAELHNRTSQVVLARQGDKTTLTLVADYEGDLSDFALLLPVPESLDPDKVRALDPYIVDRLDRYSTPRLVEYTCRDAVTLQSPGCVAGGCASADPRSSDGTLQTVPVEVETGAAAGTVTVEAQFQVAEYDVVLLAASGAGGLYDWLDENGFAVPPGGEDILQEYIDAGSHFLAAKVHLDAVPDGGLSRLSPLQLRYTAPTWSLPIRIGTISASGEQEVVIYALTELLDGDVAIANYPEQRLRDECMLPEGASSEFATFYRDALWEARGEEGAGWVTEYNWTLYKLTQDTGYHCDPCTVEREELYDAGELHDLGFNDPTGGTSPSPYTYTYGYGDPNGALLTRIRMVYDPEEVTEDLVLYTTGYHDRNRQIRYVDYDRRLEFLFPVCGEGYVEEPGMCGDELDRESKRQGRSGFPVLVGALGAIGLLIRRSAK